MEQTGLGTCVLDRFVFSLSLRNQSPEASLYCGDVQFLRKQTFPLITVMPQSDTLWMSRIGLPL